MHEHGLAKELFPQLQQIAEAKGLLRVTRIDMTVGSLHGVAAEMLIHSFEHAFEGTSFQGAEVLVRVVDPGDSYESPGIDEPATASGWELLITRIEGTE